MTGSPVFSINLTNRKNPSNLNYHMSIKKSQAILKHFIDLKVTVWSTLCSENETIFLTLRTGQGFSITGSLRYLPFLMAVHVLSQFFFYAGGLPGDSYDPRCCTRHSITQNGRKCELRINLYFCTIAHKFKMVARRKFKGKNRRSSYPEKNLFIFL